MEGRTRSAAIGGGKKCGASVRESFPLSFSVSTDGKPFLSRTTRIPFETEDEAFHDGGDRKGVKMPPWISCPGPAANPIVSINLERTDETPTGSGSKMVPCLAEHRKSFLAYPLRICIFWARNRKVRVPSPDEDISRALFHPLRAPPEKRGLHR